MIERSHIGFTTPKSSIVIDAWRVKLFCQSIGETNPVYWDTPTALAAGFSQCPAPPTFLKVLENEHCSSALLLDLLGVPLRTVLHAAQSFEYSNPVYVGDSIDISRSISDIYDKREGALSFIVVDTHYYRNGAPIGTSRQTVVTRNEPAATEVAQ